jgi:hypothetical protein
LSRKIPHYSLFLGRNSLFVRKISLLPAPREWVSDALKSLHEWTPAGPGGAEF